MLDKLGMANQTKTIHEKWGSYVRLASDVMPVDYRLLYPDQLLQSLINQIYKACQSTGLKVYTNQRQTAGNINIPLLINEAWEMFLKMPNDYSVWEAAKINDLKKALQV